MPELSARSHTLGYVESTRGIPNEWSKTKTKRETVKDREGKMKARKRERKCDR